MTGLHAVCGGGRLRWLRAALGAVCALSLVVWLAWSSSALATSPSDRAVGCDPIDPSLCLLPWPNDFFTRRDRSTATGLRLNIDPRATPRNMAGAPIDTTDWNRLDGFSPGAPI